MKSIILVALLVASAVAGPIAPRADFAAAKATINEIYGVVSGAIGQIKTISAADNADAGAAIATRLDAAADEARPVFDDALAQVDAEDLTVAEAEAMFASLISILDKARADVAADIAKLSEGAQGQCTGVFESAYASAEQLAQRLYGELAALSARAPNWDAAKATVNEIYTLVSETLAKIKSTATAEDAAVGADISAKLDAAAEEARPVFETALAAIDAQTLTSAAAKVEFEKLLAILAAVRENVAEDLAQLSAAAQETISAEFNNAYTQGQAKAEELYANLDS